MTITAPVRATGPTPATTPGISTPALPAGANAGMPAGRPDGTTLLGMKLVLAADTMVLVAMLVVYFTIKGGAAAWPPKGVKVGTYLPTIITITAVMSAVSASWMLFCVRRNDQRNAFAAAVLTVLLGTAVANAQWYSITNAKFGANSHAYGSLYKALLGFHLAQVLAGIVMIVVVAAQALAGHYGSDDHEPVSAVVWFWQFTNVAWFVIVMALFVLSPHATK
ncbi:MAG: cytochrome c oxidase subunit 3 [Acidimicrobiales bacterium]